MNESEFGNFFIFFSFAPFVLVIARQVNEEIKCFHYVAMLICKAYMHGAITKQVNFRMVLQ